MEMRQEIVKADRRNLTPYERPIPPRDRCTCSANDGAVIFMVGYAALAVIDAVFRIAWVIAH
jgi:hypothetical protein